jgi:superoxide dismutase, Fe-Mn family
MKNVFSRRDVITKVFPAATLMGLGMGGVSAFAEEKSAGETKNNRQDNVIGKMMKEAFENGQYKLPELPYSYDGLEPHIDAKTLQLHHDKHHQSYVDGLNETIEAIADLRGKIDDESAKLSGLERNLSFNAGGHILHTLFWATMAPNAGGEPTGNIADAINNNFDSFDFFKTYFSKVATTIKGSGWALLNYEPIGDKLIVFAVNDHDKYLSTGTIPLLTVDVWEHAYYLKYQNNRKEFVKAWWNLVNWNEVDKSYTWIRRRFQDKEEI